MTAAAGVAYARGGNTVPSRKIQDASFYLGLLNSKEKQIENELHKLQDETKEMEFHCTSFADRQGAFDQLLGEVRALEETMSDYNLAYEKERHGSDPEDIESFALDLKHSNEEKANEVDGLFMENQRHRREIDQAEKGISNTLDSFHSLLEKSDQHTITEYERLTTELKDLKDESTDIEAEIAQLRGHMNELQTVVVQKRDNRVRESYDQEAKQATSIKSEMTTINEELRIAQMGLEEARVYLLDKVKADKSKVVELDQEYAMLEDEMRQIDKAEREILKEIGEKESFGASSERDIGANARMYWKSKEAQEYLASSSETIEDIKLEHAAKQANIVSLLEDLSRGIDASEMDMPTKEGLRILNDDADFKAKHLANSKQTMNRLIGQKEKRRVEVRTIQMFHSIFMKAIFVRSTDLLLLFTF